MNTKSENAIDVLINECTNALESNTFNMNIVGNRMHYPMLITINGDNASVTKEIFCKYFRRMWPQTHENIIFVKNKFSDLGNFIDMQTGSAISVEELQNRLDQLRSKHGVFENFLKICLYNIIDTSAINSIDKFTIQYNLLEKLKEISGMSVQSMLIVLLDESTSKQNLNRKIREFLSTASLYNGNIVIANKSISGEMYEYKDIANVAATIVALSNNDAFSEEDDDDYNERVNTLYSGRTFTVAHSLLSRPNRKIAIQIINILANYCNLILSDKNEIYSTEKWKQVLGMDHGVVNYFENELNKLVIDCNYEELQYIPYKKIPDKELDFNKITYAQFENYIFEESFGQYIQKQCNEKLVNSNYLNSLIENYKCSIKNELTSNNCKELTDSKIDEIMGSLVVNSPEKNVAFLDYYRSKVKSIIREKYIYPQLKSFLKELRNDSEKTIEDFVMFKNEFITKLPLDSFAELGVFYSNIVENYIASIIGNKKVRSIVVPGNNFKTICKSLFEVFENILETNENKFNLTFIDEWVQRLNLTGEVILREIEKTFNKDFEKRLFLSGNYPRHNQLDVYIFHTFDNNLMPTELFNHFKKTFDGVDNVQFVNSGCDDFVESIRFIDCSGSKLIL